MLKIHPLAGGEPGEPLWRVAQQPRAIRLGACMAGNLGSGPLPEMTQRDVFCPPRLVGAANRATTPGDVPGKRLLPSDRAAIF
jgi:hypothetical protein